MEKRARGRRGEGHIKRLGKDYYLVQVNGRRPDGSRARKAETVHGPRSEAVKARDRLNAKLNAGLDIDGGMMPFSEFAAKWLRLRRESGKLEKRTLMQSESIVGVLVEHLGGVRLDKINTALVDSTLLDIKAQRGISNTTLRGYYTQLNMILGKAVTYGYIAKNPCQDADKPKADKSKRKALGIEDARRVIECIERDFEAQLEKRGGIEARRDARGDDSQRVQLVGLAKCGALVALRLELCNGLRGGEAFGLTWGAVDLVENALEIRAALDLDRTLKGTKNDSSTRTVYLDDDTASMLKRWKAVQRSELLRLGIKQGGSTPVACSNKGGFMDEHNARKYYRNWLRANGFDITPHELRHTWATLLGVGVETDLPTAMELGGWASPDVLLEIYAHGVEGKKRQAARAMGNMLKGDRDNSPDAPGNAPKPAIKIMFKAS